MFWVYTKYFISKLFELRRKYCSLRYWLSFMLNLGIAEFLEKVVKVLGVIFLHLTLLVYMTKKVNASFKLQILKCNKFKIQNATSFLFTITCSNTFFIFGSSQSNSNFYLKLPSWYPEKSHFCVIPPFYLEHLKHLFVHNTWNKINAFLLKTSFFLKKKYSVAYICSVYLVNK